MPLMNKYTYAITFSLCVLGNATIGKAIDSSPGVNSAISEALKSAIPPTGPSDPYHPYRDESYRGQGRWSDAPGPSHGEWEREHKRHHGWGQGHHYGHHKHHKHHKHRHHRHHGYHGHHHGHHRYHGWGEGHHKHHGHHHHHHGKGKGHYKHGD